MNSISNQLKSSLNSQCFLDFPSGKGSWNSDIYVSEGDSITEEDLIELVCSSHSPWKTENELSNEIVQIKKELIKRKGSNRSNFIKKHLRSLRLLDKDICLLDEGLKTLENINELILSANSIANVKAEWLPKNLKVFEVYYNKISSLKFCSHNDLPYLEHLGVGANQITDLSPLTESVLRTSLVSLDLSKNFLTDLSSTVSILSQLKSIKNLILAGNPLSLVAIYRGFVVDSIESLYCLDDIPISADERYAVKKMKFLPESLMKLCKLKISIPSINNIPAKEVPENMPEEPVIKTEFYVKFWFPFQNISVSEVQTSADEDIINSDNAASAASNCDSNIFYLHKSESHPRMSPEIAVNFVEDVSIHNVGIFCKFLDEPFRVSVMEETKYLYSPENLPSKAPSRIDSQSSKRRAQNKSANKNAPKDPNKAKKDAGKKKKIDESKLVLHSKSVRRLVEYLVNISDFKNGETSFDQILKANIIQPMEVDNKSGKPQESKGKKSSAKERSKSPEKSIPRKGAKTPTAPSDPTEEVKPVECHLTLSLLTIKNVKMTENY